jgi:hypothetical protein
MQKTFGQTPPGPSCRLTKTGLKGGRQITFAFNANQLSRFDGQADARRIDGQARSAQGSCKPSDVVTGLPVRASPNNMVKNS